MDRTLISWNFPNWFTVSLMGLGGYGILLLLWWLFNRSVRAGGNTAGY